MIDITQQRLPSTSGRGKLIKYIAVDCKHLSEKLADARDESIVDTSSVALALSEAVGERVDVGRGGDRSRVSSWNGVLRIVVSAGGASLRACGSAVGSALVGSGSAVASCSSSCGSVVSTLGLGIALDVGGPEELADTGGESVVDALAVGLALSEAGGKIGGSWSGNRGWIALWLRVHWAGVSSEAS